jgi:hypothetical protein
VSYEDFEKVFTLADNSGKNLKREAKTNPARLFRKYHCEIIGQTREFLIAVPLDRQCAVFFNSFNCGGEGARWCIGDKEYDGHWRRYLSGKNIFFLVYFIEKNEMLGKKILIQYRSAVNHYTVWNQNDEAVSDCYDCIDLLDTYNPDLMESVNRIIREAIASCTQKKRIKKSAN